MIEIDSIFKILLIIIALRLEFTVVCLDLEFLPKPPN